MFYHKTQESNQAILDRVKKWVDHELALKHWEEPVIEERKEQPPEEEDNTFNVPVPEQNQLLGNGPREINLGPMPRPQRPMRGSLTESESDEFDEGQAQQARVE